MYNREGDRNFALVIENEEIADALTKEGWNVKVKPPREDGEAPFMYMPVKIKFNERGPNVYLKSGNATVKLDESQVYQLDRVYIASVDLDLRPYDWGPINGKSGRTAYLQSIRVTQAITDRFAERHDFMDDDDMPY